MANIPDMQTGEQRMKAITGRASSRSWYVNPRTPVLVLPPSPDASNILPPGVIGFTAITSINLSTNHHAHFPCPLGPCFSAPACYFAAFIARPASEKSPDPVPQLNPIERGCILLQDSSELSLNRT
ncbi:hypothetical protein P691DRAFT_403631 [Macrolepiota fuliginosa MF-IS2]|uniref:Uncharacterized protein n=1 Tax=Macrolepiota fuliginosa MF-IS2 TaxID=1400762 RepID=A0A9P6BZM5_9AGAR|nr:hypothetical protein P691DRAFT_403631 [Macrolepiota fuliginosa MF-IS2]